MFVKNIHYKKDIDYALRSDWFVFASCGIWPEKNNFLVIIVIGFFWSISFASMTLDFLVLLGKVHLNILMSAWTTIAYAYQNVVKLYIMCTRRELANASFDQIKDDYKTVDNEELRRLMLDNAKVARTFAVVCTLMLWVSGFGYTLFLPLVTKQSITFDNNSERILPYMGEFIIPHIDTSPYYEILYFFNTYLMWSMTSLSSGIYNHMAKLSLHVCSKCQIVKFYLNKLTEDVEETENYNERIQNIAKRHWSVIK